MMWNFINYYQGDQIKGHVASLKEMTNTYTIILQKLESRDNLKT
jgi:hypothetical protein